MIYLPKGWKLATVSLLIIITMEQTVQAKINNISINNQVIPPFPGKPLMIFTSSRWPMKKDI